MQFTLTAQQLIFLSFKNRLRAIENSQFFEYLIDVNLDGLFFDFQKVRNDFVGMTQRYQVKHFQLPLGQSDIWLFFCRVNDSWHAVNFKKFLQFVVNAD